MIKLKPLLAVSEQPYVVAEVTMSGRSGFDISSSGQAFNTLAAYLFGKVTYFRLPAKKE